MNTRRTFLKIVALLASAFPVLGRIIPSRKQFRIKLETGRTQEAQGRGGLCRRWVSALNFDLHLAYLLGYSKFSILKDGDELVLTCDSKRAPRNNGNAKYANRGQEVSCEGEFVEHFNFYSGEMEKRGDCGFSVIPNEFADTLRILAFRFDS